MNKDQLWKTVLSDLEISLSRGNFMTWIKPTTISNMQKIDAGKQVLEVVCPSAYHRQYIEERYLDQIREVVDKITKQNNELVFVVGNSSKNKINNSHVICLGIKEKSIINLL